MNRGTFVLALAAVALVTAAVPIAQGTTDSVPSRLTAAERKIATLQRDVRTLRTALGATAAVVACLDRPVPVTVYGGSPTAGYVFRDTAQGQDFLTSALDVTEQGDTPSAIIAGINPQCVQAFAAVPSARGDRNRAARAIPLLRLKPAER